MNDQEMQVIETVLEMLHGLIGRADASRDFRPILPKRRIFRRGTAKKKKKAL